MCPIPLEKVTEVPLLLNDLPASLPLTGRITSVLYIVCHVYLYVIILAHRTFLNYGHETITI